MTKVGVEAAERAGALVLLTAMVLAATVWQAVRLGVARVHMLLEGIDPKARARRDKRSDRNQS